MPYEHRFGRTTKRNDCRHDPGYAGIFIHGGCCNSGCFSHNNTANRFSLTLPSCNKRDQEIPEEIRSAQRAEHFPTFQQAVNHALWLRDQHGALADCPIYACTDMLMDTTYSGSVGVQLISAAPVAHWIKVRAERKQQRHAWKQACRQAKTTRPFFAELERLAV